jgi:acyl dehydratase
VSERLARELPAIDAAIGVFAGRAVAGNVGAEHRFEYTVIGDPVNEAARLCELAKQRPERVLASQASSGVRPRRNPPGGGSRARSSCVGAASRRASPRRPAVRCGAPSGAPRGTSRASPRLTRRRAGHPDRREREATAGGAVAEASSVIGKTYEPFEYEVGREKIREYATAIGEINPVHLDPAAAREAGHRALVAPPMFAVVYSAPAMLPALFDPEVAMNFAMMVHGGQEFVWSELFLAGDVITTTASVKDISQREAMTFYVFESVSANQDGREVVRGTWTNIVREG